MWIKLRVTETERARWLGKAGEAGVTLSALIRQGLDGLPVRRPRRRTETDPALLRALARIGNNLNQVARWANRNKAGAEARGVLVALIEIDREIAALRRSLEVGQSSAGQARGSGAGAVSGVPDSVHDAPAGPAGPC